jgi:ABC-2 type transport system ATP-binding protein
LDVPLIGDNIFQSYNNSNYIIKNMSILLKKGEIYSLIGSNGAGKSTFFNIMTGILKPTMGKIKYFGQDLHKMSFKDHIRVGYCPQFDYLYDILTV